MAGLSSAGIASTPARWPRPPRVPPARPVIEIAMRLEQELAMMCRLRAPSASFTPISCVRSLTTTYMMLATPTPATSSVNAAHQAHEDLDAEPDGQVLLARPR